MGKGEIISEIGSGKYSVKLKYSGRDLVAARQLREPNIAKEASAGAQEQDTRSEQQKQEDKILDNWFLFVANKTLQLFRKYKVDV